MKSERKEKISFSYHQNVSEKTEDFFKKEKHPFTKNVEEIIILKVRFLFDGETLKNSPEIYVK
jgi:hypothetical protein